MTKSVRPHIQPYWTLAVLDVAEIVAGNKPPRIAEDER